MTQIFIFTAAGREARRHLDESIRKPIERGKLYEGADSVTSETLNRVDRQVGAFYAWGAEPGDKNRSTWRKMEEGDFVICVFEMRYHYVARVVALLDSEELAERIWGRNEESGETWRLMYFITEPQPVSVDVPELADYLHAGYRGFVRIGDDRLDRLRRDFGSVESFVESRLLGGAIDLSPIDDFLPVMRRYEHERVVFLSLVRGNRYRVLGVRDESAIIARKWGGEGIVR